MPTYSFQAYRATAKATFTCVNCEKPNRVRTFRHECTVNPFNKNENGSIRTPSEVRAQSSKKAMDERVTFMRHPLCATCENALSYTERKEIRAKRAPSEMVQS